MQHAGRHDNERM